MRFLGCVGMLQKAKNTRLRGVKCCGGGRLANLDGSHHLRRLARDISAGGVRVDIES